MTGPVSAPDPAADLRTRIAVALSKAATGKGTRLGRLRFPLADAAVEAMREHVTDVHETNSWLSEACRLTVREAASVRDERDRLLKDATPARQKLMDLIGGDWTVEPSLFDLAYYAERFWGQDRKDLASLRETAGLVSGSTPTIPDDAAGRDVALRAADALAEVWINAATSDGSWKQTRLSRGDRHDIALVLQQAGLLASPAPPVSDVTHHNTEETR